MYNVNDAKMVKQIRMRHRYGLQILLTFIGGWLVIGIAGVVMAKRARSETPSLVRSITLDAATAQPRDQAAKELRFWLGGRHIRDYSLHVQSVQPFGTQVVARIDLQLEDRTRYQGTIWTDGRTGLAFKPDDATHHTLK